jgi:hypothetical protein
MTRRDSGIERRDRGATPVDDVVMAATLENRCSR